MTTAQSFHLEQTLRQASTIGVAPALAVGVIRSNGLCESWYAGHHTESPHSAPCGPHTIFDLASLTKPLTTSLAFYRLISERKLKWDTPIGDLIHVEESDLSGCPVWRLLNHTTGLPAHRRYFEGLGPPTLESLRFEAAKKRVLSMIGRTALDDAPGKRENYSDLGYLILEQCIQSIAGSFDKTWTDLPHHKHDGLHFRKSGEAGDPSLYAATETCPWRDRRLVGEVHDDNCWTMGGVCGHAGLFGTLHSVLAIGQDWLRALRGEPHTLGVETSVLKDAVSHRWMHPQGTRVLGWDTPTPGNSSSGKFLSRATIGHLGFTGTSIWIDAEQDICIALLTNRVCPTRTNPRIQALRPRVHDLVYQWLKEGST